MGTCAGPSEAAKRAGTSRRWEGAVSALSAVLFAWISARLAYAAWQMAYSPSMDYAVVVEMARNMASGADWPVFFYGQAYMGSLEPAVSALLCALFGPHPFCVCMGTALFAIATLAAMALAARRLGGAAAMPPALLLTAGGGIYWMHFMVSPRGGYSLATLLALAALYLGAVAEFDDAGTGKVRPWRAALAGLVAGLVFWNFWLALPAVAAGALVLLARLRKGVLSRRFLLPAMAAFFVGSAPWWIWMAHPDPLSLAGGGHLPPLGLAGPREILTTVLPVFFGYRDASMWRTPFPWPLVALAAFTALDALTCRGGRPAAGEPPPAARRRFLVATVLFTGLFVVAYSFSSFGASRVARYFVVLIPPWCVATASALAAAVPSPRRRPFAVVLFAVCAVFTLAHSVLEADAFLAKMQGDDMAWRDRMRAAADDPALAEPAFADFKLFGANWVTDRRLCLSSPLRWRYRPYLEALERASSPAVVNDFMKFQQFCAATGGEMRTRNVEGLTVACGIKAPPPLREVPSGKILDMLNCRDEVHGDLIDDNIATVAVLTGGGNSFVDVLFREETECSGARAVVTYSSAAYGWRAEAVGDDGSLTPLSHLNPFMGWFWSGGRQYAFGPAMSWEIRWKPVKARRLRITFEGSGGDVPDGAYTICLADLRILSAEKAEGPAKPPLPPPDGRKLFAPRHLANRPDPALAYGVLGSSLALRSVCDYCGVNPEAGAVLVLEPDAAAAAMETLASCGVRAELLRGGIYDTVSIPVRGGAATCRLRHYGGRLFRDDPSREKSLAGRPGRPVAEFGGDWTISSETPIPADVRPGDSLSLYFSIAPDREMSPFRHDTLFVHAVRGGRIVAQGNATVYGAAAGTPADNPRPGLSNVHIDLPRDLAPGPVEFMMCVKKSNGLFRLRPSVEDDGLRIDRRRLVIGSAMVAGNSGN